MRRELSCLQDPVAHKCGWLLALAGTRGADEGDIHRLAPAKVLLLRKILGDML
jgi:hypothetical protein